MTPEELNELERLEKAATPGPWIAVPYRRRFYGEEPRFDNGICHVLPESDPERLPILTVDRGDDHHAETREHADIEAAFIAALRNAAPDLIRAAREADELREELRRSETAATERISRAEQRAEAAERERDHLALWQEQQMERCQDIGRHHVLQNWEQMAPAAICQSLSRELAGEQQANATLRARIEELLASDLHSAHQTHDHLIEIAGLRAENAKLTKQYAVALETVERFRSERDALAAERARIRQGFVNILEFRKIAGSDRYGALTREEIEEQIALLDAAGTKEATDAAD